jgi:RsiW-degrading membrane proteinase PrsW (M82 family)
MDGGQPPGPPRAANRSWWDTRAAEILVVGGGFSVVVAVIVGASLGVPAAYHRWIGPTPSWWGVAMNVFRSLTFAGFLWVLWDRYTKRKTSSTSVKNPAVTTTPGQPTPGSATGPEGTETP